MLCINTANGGSDLNGVNFEDRRGPAVYIIIIIIIMEKTEAGLERPLYPRNRCRITNTCYTIL